MHCPNCGQKTDSKLKFCRSCGMKLDSVARALDEHLDSGQAAESGESGEPGESQEKGSDERAMRNVIYLIFTGFIIVFIGAALAILGKQISPWVKMTGALLALFGILVSICSAMYAAIRGEKALRPASSKREPKDMEEGSAGELLPGDDFVPAPSVTESTTRNLDTGKAKVSKILKT